MIINDIEVLLIKVYNEFSSAGKKVETLKSIFDFLELEYNVLLRYLPVHPLSLYPALDRLLKMWKL